MAQLDTEVCLKPGYVPRDIIREVLHLILEEFRWFIPARHSGTGVGKDRRLKGGSVSVEALVSLYLDTDVARSRTIRLFEGSDAKDFLFVHTVRESSEYPYINTLTWCTRVLGPECFFDHGQLRPPTRRPRLPASWIPG